MDPIFRKTQPGGIGFLESILGSLKVKKFGLGKAISKNVGWGRGGEVIACMERGEGNVRAKTIYRRLKHFSLVWQSLCLAISMNVLRGPFGNSWGPFL
jgi:hypothetical protein